MTNWKAKDAEVFLGAGRIARFQGAVLRGRLRADFNPPTGQKMDCCTAESRSPQPPGSAYVGVGSFLPDSAPLAAARHIRSASDSYASERPPFGKIYRANQTTEEYHEAATWDNATGGGSPIT